MKISGEKLTLRALLFAALLVLAGLPSEALAKGFELGVGLGAMKLDDNLVGEEEPRYELRLGYLLSDDFELELQYAETTSVLDLELRLVMVNAVFNLRKNAHLVPYTLVGAGVATLKVTPLSEAPVEDDALAYQTAVGLRLYFGQGKRAALRVELSLLGEEAFFSSSHMSLTTGVGWRF